MVRFERTERGHRNSKVDVIIAQCLRRVELDASAGSDVEAVGTELPIMNNIYEFPPGRCRGRRKDTNVHRGPGEAERDLSGKYALIADLFWYFGDQPPELPERFRDRLDLPNPRRGHRVLPLTGVDMDDLQNWLESQALVVMTPPPDLRHGCPDRVSEAGSDPVPSNSGGVPRRPNC